jgi:hypothetical protein
MLVQDHLHLVEQSGATSASRGFRAIAGRRCGRRRPTAAGHRNGRVQCARSCRYQRSAVATWKVPTIRELAIEFVDDGLRLREVIPRLPPSARISRSWCRRRCTGSAHSQQGRRRLAGGVFAEDAESGVGNACSPRPKLSQRVASSDCGGRWLQPAARDQRVQARAGEGVEVSRSSGSGQMSSGTTRVSCMRDGRVFGGGGRGWTRAAAAWREDGSRQGAVAPGKSVA